MTKSDVDRQKVTLYCNFCGKSQYEVGKLIAGPRVFICDECVELCLIVIDEERPGRIRDFQAIILVDLTEVAREVEKLSHNISDALRPLALLSKRVRELTSRISDISPPSEAKSKSDEKAE